jgi:hypothetical protein
LTPCFPSTGCENRESTLYSRCSESLPRLATAFPYSSTHGLWESSCKRQEQPFPFLPCSLLNRRVFIPCLKYKNYLVIPTLQYISTTVLCFIGHSSKKINFQIGRHRVDRVPGFLSSRPNWVSPLPHLQASVATSLGSGGGGHTCLRGRRGGAANSDEGQTL